MNRKAGFSAVLCAVVMPGMFYLLAFGVAVLFGVPTHARQSFWTPEKLVYGLLLIIVTLWLLAATVRYWIGQFKRPRNAWLMLCVVAITGTALGLVVFFRLHGRQDKRIHVEWQERSSVFSWGTGEVRIPTGFKYERLTGIDTFMGRFISKESNLIVEYDIGELAAAHGGMGNSETLIEGSRVRLGRATYSDDRGNNKYFFKVSFPDASCANFSMESTSEKDGNVVEGIASSFRPRGSLLPFLRPLLLEVLRSDCRYRMSFPRRL